MAGTELEQVEVVCTAGRTRWRRWGFRAAALCLGLFPLIGFEGVCAYFDWGRPSLHDDPFVGFSDIRPLFVLNEDQTRYEIPLARQGWFRPESFSATKAPAEFRIFCLGGSTVQGRPFAIETSFTTWLELSLQAADPSHTWEVVNCGGISYATYRLIPILQEVLRYQPDLIVYYEGHNEFLEDRSFEHITQRSPLLDAPLRAASHLRTFALMREGCLRLSGRSSYAPPEGRSLLPAEVDALLDYRGGLDRYHWDPEWREMVIEQFRFSLRRLIGIADAAGVPIIVMNPVSNLKDCPPFKSEHRQDLTEAQLREWESLFEQAFGLLNQKVRDFPEAIRLMQHACEIDPQHAGGFYHLAQTYHAAGDAEHAREAFLRAKDLDVCPLRILEPMREAMFEIAEDTHTPIVDVYVLFQEREEDGIPGGYWLVDHVHPTVAGHQVIADALAERIVQLGLVRPLPDWKSRQQELFDRHLDSLDDLYFYQGMDRLAGERGWAQGRATLMRPSAKRDSN